MAEEGSIVSSPVSQDLPIDLVRCIFEWAAYTPVTAATLCRVSKTVNGWVLPILYHTVVLRNIGSYHSFCNTWRQQRSGTLRVRNLYLAPSVRPDILDLAPQNVVVSPLMLSYFPEPTVGHLTHLIIHDGRRIPNFGDVIFTSVTHLYFTSHISNVQNAGYTIPPLYPTYLRFPRLTHCVSSPIGDGLPWVQAHVRYLHRIINSLNHFRDLRVFGLWHDIRSNANLASFLKMIDHPGHPSLILVSAKAFDLEEWNHWLCGGETIWEAAERSLNTRNSLQLQQDSIAYRAAKSVVEH